MPGRLHQSLVWLLRRDPKLPVELAARVVGRSLPSTFVAIDRGNMHQRPSLEARSLSYERTVDLDILLSLHELGPSGMHGSRVLALWIVEVQTVRDLTRAQAWFDYFSAAARHFEVPTVDVEFLVVCPDPVLRSWIERRIFSQMRTTPTLLGPTHVPWIDSVLQARARPEAAVLSAVFHGRQLRAQAVVRAAWHAVAHLDQQSKERYRYLINTAAHPDMQLPDPPMVPNPDEQPTAWERGGLTWGQHAARSTAQGRQEGRQEGLGHARRSFLLMLELFGLPLSPSQRELIERCEDYQQFERWIQRLPSATSTAALFEPT